MKKQQILKWTIALVFPALLVISCQKNVSQADLELSSDESGSIGHVDYSQYIGDPRAEACRVVTLDEHHDHDHSTDPRGAAITSKLWRPGTVINVSFIGGSNFVRQRVMTYAKQWEQFANITFNFVESNGVIRVAFIQGAGSYSYLGTDARLINANRETMNFGWFDDSTPEEEFSRTTLHEFGHALGLVHEHQHPNAALDWDREFVYAFYAGAPNFWSRAAVDNNLLNRYNPAQLTFNNYDERSIMHYSILGRLINRNQNTPFNTVLSNGDRQIATILYPF